MRLGAAAVLAAGLIAGTLAVPGVAYADPPPPCYGGSCVGVDPIVHNASGECDGGAQTLDTAHPPGGGPAVELRWSDWCHANWAKIDDFSEPSAWNYWVETWDGTQESAIPYQGYRWTYMVDGTQLARACIQGFETSQYNCTGWH
ncbi:MAG TPA: DUF2690 domain-containing protein [Streptosporangiaceae bacterium]|nr:DUF2690 domain-containing protein [Streptosporangiaceae bacterium]